GNVHERFAKGKNDRLAVDLQSNFVTDYVAKRAEVVALNVGDERAERIVESDDLAGNSFFFDSRDFGIQADEFADLRAGDGVIPTGGEVGGGGRKNVASMKCRRDGRREHPGRVGDFAGGVETVAI